MAATEAIRELLEVREQFQDAVRADGGKGRVIDLAGDLIGFPILDVRLASSLLGISYQAANTAVGRLTRLGILHKASGKTYGRVFRCERVYQIIARA
jgi:hypothetical protein